MIPTKHRRHWPGCTTASWLRDLLGRTWTAFRTANDHNLAMAADAALEFGQHLSATPIPWLRQPDPAFGSVVPPMCFGFSGPSYGRWLIWTAVMASQSLGRRRS